MQGKVNLGEEIARVLAQQFLDQGIPTAAANQFRMAAEETSDTDLKKAYIEAAKAAERAALLQSSANIVTSADDRVQQSLKLL